MYRIATTRCLNMLRRLAGGPREPALGVEPPEPSRLRRGCLARAVPGPAARGPARRRTRPGGPVRGQGGHSLAFVTALQLLPPRQRAALILRDVLGFPAGEVAGMLERAGVGHQRAQAGPRYAAARNCRPPDRKPPPPDSAARAELVARVDPRLRGRRRDGLVALMTEDAWLRMPPVPLEYQGRELAGRFCRDRVPEGRRYRLVPTRANGQPAFGVYLRDPKARSLRANGLMVLTLAGGRISAITRFDNPRRALRAPAHPARLNRLALTSELPLPEYGLAHRLRFGQDRDQVHRLRNLSFGVGDDDACLFRDRGAQFSGFPAGHVGAGARGAEAVRRLWSARWLP